MNLKDDLIHYYQWLRQYGVNDSHSGNISVRDDSLFWVTPTGACADSLTPDELIQCSVKDALPDGASLDARLHQLVYQKNPLATAVIHSHGPHIVALTMNGKDYIPPDFEGQYYFPRVPVLSINYARCITEAAEKVSDALIEYPVVIVRGHGVYAQGTSLNLAYKWSCSLEMSAKTTFIARQAGTII
jgi:L-fuculose-phosphate aldolase